MEQRALPARVQSLFTCQKETTENKALVTLFLPCRSSFSSTSVDSVVQALSMTSSLGTRGWVVRIVNQWSMLQRREVTGHLKFTAISLPTRLVTDQDPTMVLTLKCWRLSQLLKNKEPLVMSRVPMRLCSGKTTSTQPPSHPASLTCKSLKGWRCIPNGSFDFVNRLLVSGTAFKVQHRTLK